MIKAGSFVAIQGVEMSNHDHGTGKPSIDGLGVRESFSVAASMPNKEF
ncbi:hypothetical protein O23A_p4428 [Aeromonas salmonicida]|nr:hypothetical protein O23A_p4428 [Aeromonas salmonicida]